MPEETVKEFIELVAKMRAAQKQYFKTRSREVLIESKRLEAAVDQTLEALQKQFSDEDPPPWEPADRPPVWNIEGTPLGEAFRKHLEEGKRKKL